jgi:hypothetical protein
MWKITIFLVFLVPSFVFALEATPTSEQIEQAKNEGRKMAETYRANSNAGITELTAFINRYELGTGGICGGGHITTKLKNIVLSSYLEAKEGRALGEEAVQNILKDEKVEVEIGSCYSSPSHSKDHVVLKQNEKVIQPQDVQQTSKMAQSRMYLNMITASFELKDLDPEEPCTLVLIPATGEEKEFEVNLASMP